MKFSDLLTPLSLRVYQENYDQFKSQGFLHDIELEMQRKDGSTFVVVMSATGNKGFGGRYAMNRSTIFNITDRKRTERALQESEERFRNIMDNAPIGMSINSLDGKFIQVNRLLCEITGYKREELEQLSFQELTHSDDLPFDISHIKQLIEGKERSYRIEERINQKNGSLTWVQVTRSILRDKTSGMPLYFISQLEDISERKHNQERIYQLAYHDILTGFPNRQLLLDRINQALTQAKRYKRFFSIMFMDLDKFKHINDTLGHDAGDELLKIITSRLNLAVRSGDTISRTGGDEFVIVLTEISSPEGAAIEAEKIIKLVNEPMSIHGEKIQIGASIGIVIYPIDATDLTELMKKADLAIYQAKDAGGNQYHFLT